MPLNPKQARFVAEYLIDSNATRAAKSAGYSARTARSQGQRLLTKVDIARALQSAQSAQIDRLILQSDSVLERVRRIADGTADVSNRDKLRALELLMRHLGLLKDTAAPAELGPVFMLPPGTTLNVSATRGRP